MSMFRKKPVVVEAFRWTGGPDQTDYPVWIINALKRGDVQIAPGRHCPIEMTIATLEGRMNAYPGYWIIKGVKGELYPCKPDIFEATYEAIPTDGTSAPISKGQAPPNSPKEEA